MAKPFIANYATSRRFEEAEVEIEKLRKELEGMWEHIIRLEQKVADLQSQY